MDGREAEVAVEWSESEIVELEEELEGQPRKEEFGGCRLNDEASLLEALIDGDAGRLR